MVGRVVSKKMINSAVVLIEGVQKHPLYGKRFMRGKKYLVDDPIGVKEGDVVEIVKSKPISKRKHFQIAKVIGKDIVAVATEKLKEVAKEAIEEVLPEEKLSDAEAMESKDEVRKQKNIEEPKAKKEFKNKGGKKIKRS